MATIPSARASFKKKDGVLTVSADQTRILWSSGAGDGPPTVSLALVNVASKPEGPGF
jgi:transcription initiation factor TFIIH subunit 1